MNDSLINRAKQYAASAHEAVNQVRKYTNEPYIIHPATVASKVKQVTDDPRVIAAAWLHDTVEDTNVTLEDIKNEFGLKIHDLVESLTDISKSSDGNRKIRKELDRQHTKQASPEAKTIKLADLIDNAHSILSEDRKFAKVFIQEMKLLLEVLSEGDTSLYEEALDIVKQYESAAIKRQLA